MVQKGQLTLYAASYGSIYVHRVLLALDEAKAEYTTHNIDLFTKPEWFVTQINEAGTVPALTYGGPPSAPDQPSPEAARITESLVILEFLADLFPEARLLPEDPIARARARFFIATFQSAFVVDAYEAVFYRGESPSKFLDAFERIQKLLPEARFAAGPRWTIADAAAAPFISRVWMMLDNDVGKYPEGEGKKVAETLRGPKYARVVKYMRDLMERPTFKATWPDESVQLAGARRYFGRN